MSKSAIALIKINIRFIKKTEHAFFIVLLSKRRLKALASLLLVIVAYTKIVKTAKVVVLIPPAVDPGQTLKTSLINLLKVLNEKHQLY